MTINLTALQKQRYDTAANWTGANPTLLAGEIGIESDTLRWKVGNGSTAWTSLGYIPGLAYGTARQLLQTNSGATAAEWTSNVDIPGTLDVTGTSTLDGMVLMGTTTSIGGGKLQLSSDTTTTIQNFSFNATADSSTAMLQFIRGRGTKASPSVVLNGDYLGEIRFLGYGTTYNTGASIRAIVDGDPATAGDTSDMPTKLVFLTSPNGSSTPDTRMTIDSAGLVTIPGDLTVNGTTTTINSTTLVVQDKNIEMGVVATPTDVTADGGGITLKGTTDKTINWIDATDAWTLSEHVNIASAKEYRIAGTKVLDATSLGSAVVSSSLTSVGTIGTGVWQGSTIGKAYGGTGQTSYTDGQLLIGNSTGNTLTKSTLTAGSNITITNGNGSITIASSNPGGTVTNVSGTAPISVANGTTTPAISIAAATTSVVGAVQLSDSTSTTSSVLAATPTAVKAAYDLAAAALPLAGGTVTGNLEIGTAGSLSFEGATADGFETTIAVVDPTADRTITLPNTTGTVVTTGDTGTVTSTMLLDGTILNEDINASAAIVDTKLATIATAGKVSNSATTATDANTASAIVARDASGNFTAGTITAALTGAASSNVLKAGDTMTGVLAVTAGTAALPAITPSGDPNTGIYSPGADQLAISTSGSEKLIVKSDGKVGIGTSNPQVKSHIVDTNGDVLRLQRDGAFTGSWGVKIGQAITGDFTLRDEENNLNVISIPKGTGRVGIGTTTPDTLTHLYSSTAKTTVGESDIIRLAGQSTDSTVGARLEIGFNYAASSRKNFATIGYITTDTTSFCKGDLYFATRNVTTDTAPTERARIDSSGRLLVGTSTARSNLFNNSVTSNIVQVEGAANSTGISVITNGNAGETAYLALCRSKGTSIGSNTLVASGDVLGTLTFQGSDGTEFVDGARIEAYVDGTSGANDLPTRLVFSTTADGASSPTERMRITNNGFVWINRTTAPQTANSLLAIDGASSNLCAIFNRDVSDDSLRFTRSNTLVGSISVTTTATAYNTSSDYRLKENVAPVTDGIARLQQLKPSRFNFIADPDITVDGFIAHEVQSVVPEAITGEKDAVDADGNPIYQGIDQSKLVPLLTAALQEAIGRIETLEAEVAALKAQ